MSLNIKPSGKTKFARNTGAVGGRARGRGVRAAEAGGRRARLSIPSATDERRAALRRPPPASGRAPPTRAAVRRALHNSLDLFPLANVARGRSGTRRLPHSRRSALALKPLTVTADAIAPAW
ncbi:hypothetical protein EVAR_7642_1 [Eumeta japonica]|uniref:Uncharacterized protein n=1 Tax=Eumeta variegata TaxID=151549 RepID=A0A4C1TJB4_EUMVA|nr:hypothetical protein EVAR_7642_1 [Eumeta japonica]